AYRVRLHGHAFDPVVEGDEYAVFGGGVGIDAGPAHVNSGGARGRIEVKSRAGADREPPPRRGDVQRIDAMQPRGPLRDEHQSRVDVGEQLDSETAADRGDAVAKRQDARLSLQLDSHIR